MKQNGNNAVAGDYYVGLDVGTNSVGWAVTDTEYNILKFKGKDMWGARLFDEAKDASERRTARTNRRRLERRKQRLYLLETLFAEEIAKTDRDFFKRMHESFLQEDDKTLEGNIYSLFADSEYTDKDYMKMYPTTYHLRSDLIHNPEPHDPRLVFLALHHLIKYRGHFLFENSGDAGEKTLGDALKDLALLLEDNEIHFAPADPEKFAEELQSDDSISIKKNVLKEIYGTIEKSEDFDLNLFIDLLAGAKVQLSKLFADESLKDAEISSLSLLDDIDEKEETLAVMLEDRFDIILAAKEVVDSARLRRILGEHTYICDAKIALFDKNKKDTDLLKKYIKDHHPDDYKTIFNAIPGKKNFAAYMRYKTKEKCTQEEFCKFISPYVKDMETSENSDEQRIYREIADKTFLTKLRGTENGLIPYQLSLKELDAILDNAAGYLPFLNEKDSDEITVREKIHSIFTFKIPYYVGPLNPKAKHYWAERSNEKIYPWNFENVVDEKTTAQRFIEELIGRCTYTGEPVLPMNSLLFSEFMVLNEINPLKVNGNPVTVEVKKRIYEDLFVHSRKKVTKKSIIRYLLNEGEITKEDEISGIDDEVKANLKSLHDFEHILEKTGDRQQVEQIIKAVTVFGDNQKMLRSWLADHTKGLDSKDIKYILKLKYTGWGRLSEKFLTGIYTVNPEDGEAFSIMDMMRETNMNLMQLLSDQYEFALNAEEYKKEQFGLNMSLRDQLDEMYIAPAVRRGIWQTLRIVDEIVDIRKAAPKKIFIEMARGSAEEMKKKRTESRKKQLLALYESCKKQEKDLYQRLEGETDQTLRRDKLYLYYLQMGRCMYSGEPIDLEEMLKNNDLYDIDHIYPRSRIKDDSLNNRVLVKSVLNRDKTNIYPVSDSIREKMTPFWSMLHSKKLISDEKYKRLTRSYGLTDEELSSFVSRQLVSTQQSTKALAELLKTQYEPSRIVYSKAGNVSQFRQEFSFIKCREINDLHHAKDAYLNVVVGNVYDTKFTEKFFANIHNENYSLNRVFDFDTKGAWDSKGKSIATVRKYMRKNSPIITFMPIENKGPIADLQIVPKTKGQLPIKEGLSTEKYGGYNKVKGAYFCVVEHTKGKKRVRTIEPVSVYKKTAYEKEPERYCVEELGLIDPVVVCHKMLINSIVELDGIKYAITARTGAQIVYKHTYQFAADEEHTKYIKELYKYIDRCNASNMIFVDGEYINKTGNLELYRWFIERLNSRVYRSMKPLTNVMNDLKEGEDKFITLNTLEQARLLIEVLKSFQCNSVWTSLKSLNGKGIVGRLTLANNITNCESVSLVHQSVTGLFECKEDLLK